MRHTGRHGKRFRFASAMRRSGALIGDQRPGDNKSPLPAMTAVRINILRPARCSASTGASSHFRTTMRAGRPRTSDETAVTAEGEATTRERAA